MNLQKTAAVTGLLLTTLTAAANAQFAFTKIADTNTPTGTTGVAFTSFIGAIPGKGGGVVFTGTLSTTPATKAYFLFDGTTLTRLVSPGDAAPGGGTINVVNDTPALDPTNTVSFYASTTGGPGAGIYTAAKNQTGGVTLTAIALKGQTTPAGDKYNPSGGFSIWTNNSGEISFLSTQSTTVGSSWSVYKYSNGTNILLAQGGQAAPGEAAGDIPNTFNTFAFPTLNNNGDGTFFATVISNLSGQVIFTSSNGVLTRQVQTGDATPLGGTFSQLTQPYKNVNGLVSFRGQFNNGSSTKQGVWIKNSGVTTNIALQGNNAPGGGVYGSAFENVNLNDAGQGVYRATGMTGGVTAGIYLLAGDGTVQKVINTADTLFGTGITSLGRATLDELGRVAFDYQLTNGVKGVATAFLASQVSGTLALEGIVPAAPAQTITFTFRSAGFPDFTTTAQVSPSGTFSISLPKRNGVLHIKGAAYLAANVNVNTANGDVSGIGATLRAGDADNSNVVDIGDFGLLVNAYGGQQSVAGSGYDVHADFNGDGIVDIADFGLLVNNYGSQGDL